jgi:hypothetical protein
LGQLNNLESRGFEPYFIQNRRGIKNLIWFRLICLVTVLKLTIKKSKWQKYLVKQNSKNCTVKSNFQSLSVSVSCYIILNRSFTAFSIEVILVILVICLIFQNWERINWLEVLRNTKTMQASDAKPSLYLLSITIVRLKLLYIYLLCLCA